MIYASAWEGYSSRLSQESTGRSASVRFSEFPPSASFPKTAPRIPGISNMAKKRAIMHFFIIFCLHQNLK